MVVLYCICLGGISVQAADLPPPVSAGGKPAFNGERAFQHLRAQCAFGPRVPGTDAHEKAKAYLKAELARYADQVREQRFSAQLGPGRIEMTNLIAIFQPSRVPASASGANNSQSPDAPWVLICAHWDSRPTADREAAPARRAQAIPGANDGASGTAVILEMARLLADRRPTKCVMLVLFDGEDYGPKVDRMLLGSKHFAQEFKGAKPEWAVLLDMIGDRDLEIPIEGYSQERAPLVVERIWRAAEAVGSRAFVRKLGPRVMDDHIPLLNVGIPCINLIDFNYPYWHTLADTPDKCSPQSLQAVGDVLVQALWEGQPKSGE